MKQLEFNFTDTTNECVSCESTTKNDEWADYNKKICIDCSGDDWSQVRDLHRKKQVGLSGEDSTRYLGCRASTDP